MTNRMMGVWMLFVAGIVTASLALGARPPKPVAPPGPPEQAGPTMPQDTKMNIILGDGSWLVRTRLVENSSPPSSAPSNDVARHGSPGGRGGALESSDPFVMKAKAMLVDPSLCYFYVRTGGVDGFVDHTQRYLLACVNNLKSGTELANLVRGAIPPKKNGSIEVLCGLGTGGKWRAIAYGNGRLTQDFAKAFESIYKGYATWVIVMSDINKGIWISGSINGFTDKRIVELVQQKNPSAFAISVQRTPDGKTHVLGRSLYPPSLLWDDHSKWVLDGQDTSSKPAQPPRS